MHGTPFTPETGPRVSDVRFTHESICVELTDGRTITAPLTWFPRILAASRDERERWEVSGGGAGVHWPSIDEDVSIDGLLRGAPAPGVRG